MLERLLHSTTSAPVMGIAIFSNGLHLREIARRAKVTPPDAKRELDNLAALGIIRCERRGNQSVFYINESCPFLPELRGLYMKTEGVLEMLRSALAGLEGITYAFVYGSIAKGEYREKSDVDVLIVGSIDDDLLSKAILRAQKPAGREINYTLWSMSELRNKLSGHETFIKLVIRGKKVWLMGDEREFARLVKKTHG